MRCFALAQHWRDLGRRVTFIGRYPESLQPLLAAEGCVSVVLDRIHPDPGDLATTLQLLPPDAVAVLDGYHFDERYQAALSTAARLLVIDDAGHLPAYSGYALLNQNLHAAQVEYAEAPPLRLLGPDYALLRREFRQHRGPPRATPERVTKLLISLGGADSNNDTLGVLDALDVCEPTGIEARVVVGPINAHRESLESFAEARDWVALVHNPSDMAGLMAWAELAITSAGSICWELAVAGLPSILLALADNQIPLGREMEDAGAAVFAGQPESIATETLAAIIRTTFLDPIGRAEMSSTAARLVDGKGVIRVTEVLDGSSE